MSKVDILIPLLQLYNSLDVLPKIEGYVDLFEKDMIQQIFWDFDKEYTYHWLHNKFHKNFYEENGNIMNKYETKMQQFGKSMFFRN